MLGSRKTVSLLSALLLVLATGCGLQTDSSDEGGGEGGDGGASAPASTEFLVHTGPGGGSDIFVRDVISMLRDEEIISRTGPCETRRPAKVPERCPTCWVRPARTVTSPP